MTSTPSLNGSGDGSNGSSGLSSSSKKVIGGVVGGVGGAIILGGIGLVIWRVWGRKRAAPEDDNLMGGGNSAMLTKEERISHGGSTSISDGLERYRDPAQHNVNTASNF